MKDGSERLRGDTPAPPSGSPSAGASKVDTIDAWLPQTQCTQCGYPHCRAYAEALAADAADINQCPPGGDRTIAGLAALLGVNPKSPDPRFGGAWSRRWARIDEQRCIGCTLCIQACPVDAIVGATKLMHTVIRQECTGCELCIHPCPVDCIEMLPEPGSPPGVDWRWPDYSPDETERARKRARARRLRVAARGVERDARRKNLALRRQRHRELLRRDIGAAVARIRARRLARRAPGA